MNNNVVERIQQFNAGRDPHLIQLKYQAMRHDIFAFYRGTCHLFYQDWPSNSPLNNVPSAWVCGDLHLQNLGIYKGDNRLVYFNINDFDESALAPCTWDLARFLTCLYVSSSLLKLSSSKISSLCTCFLDVYTRTLSKAHVQLIDDRNSAGYVSDLLFQVQKRPRKAFLDSRTRQTGSARKLLIDNEHAFPITDTERAAITTLIDRWAAIQLTPAFFKVLDVAHRIAGIGSLGVPRYVILVEGKGSPDQNHLLDLKAAAPSSLEPYLTLPQPNWPDQGQRTVTIQRWIQGIAPALLAPLELDGAAYVLRELQPLEDKVDLAPLYGKFHRLEELIRIIAKTIAWDQLRSAGHQSAAPAYDLQAFAQSSSWRQPLLDYAQAYAAQVDKDYRAFCTATGA